MNLKTQKIFSTIYNIILITAFAFFFFRNIFSQSVADSLESSKYSLFGPFIYFIIGICVLFVIQFVNFQILIRRKILRMYNFFEFDEYIIFLNSYLNSNINKTTRTVFLLDKANALFNLGKTDQALLIMENIKEYIDKGSNRYIKNVYYNNYLSFLVDLTKEDESKTLFKENNNYFSNPAKPAKPFIKETVAEYNIAFGDVNDGKNELIKLLSAARTKYHKCYINYYLAVAEFRLNNNKVAIEMLKSILGTLPNNLYLYMLSDKMINKIKAAE